MQFLIFSLILLIHHTKSDQENRCPFTGMPSEGTFNFSSNSTNSSVVCNPDLFYSLDLKNSSGNNSTLQSLECCPKPFSAFIYGKQSGPLMISNYSLPAGWPPDVQTFNDSTIKQCCTIEDCEGNHQYCGQVRNPGNLLEFTKRQSGSGFASSVKSLRFCFEFPELPFEIDIESRLNNLDDRQLCKTESDCWNSRFFCMKYSNSELGYCIPVLGNLIFSIGAEDSFLVDGGCKSDEQCDELGRKWFSYQCEESKDEMKTKGNVCVGYEILCSESALYLHGKHFGCKKDSDCDKNGPKDNIHTSQCKRDRFANNRSACCYEMKSCQLPTDLNPYGIPPDGREMCSGDGECQQVADQYKNREDSNKRKTFWGRCMMELTENWGKCCISDLTEVCRVGRSTLPPKRCRRNADCGFSRILNKSDLESERNSWCDEETEFCCEDFEGERSWLCPDEKSIIFDQPKCEIMKSGDSLCMDGAGVCLNNRCCPFMNHDGDLIRVWAESPWYYSNLPCSDTSDLPAEMEMVYCDPEKGITVRISQYDRFGAPIQTNNVYCKNNSDCEDGKLICLKEVGGIQRCHTFYDRGFDFMSILGPSLLFLFLTFLFFFQMLQSLMRQWKNSRESIR